MAVSTYITNLTDLYAGAGSTTNWSALGGGQAGLNAETDYFIQGTGMTSKNAFASAKKGMILDSLSDRAATIGTDGAVLIWTTHATPNSLALQSAGGVDLIIGSSVSDYKHWYVGGSDSIEFMGWIIAAVNPSETTDEADTGTPSAVEQFFGVLFDLPTGGPTKGAPNAIDAIRVGRCDLIYELGTVADPDATFDLATSSSGNVTNRHGLIQERSGSFFLTGLHQLGSVTNVVNFTDSDKSMFWNDHPAVTKPFNTIEIQNASSVIAMTSIAMKALGTKSPGRWVTTDNATVTLTTCSFIDMGAFGLLSNTSALVCTWNNCEAVTAEGADLTGSAILVPNVTANTSGLIWNVATDPDGLIDSMTFSKTAATAHHAIEFGLNVPATMTIRNCDFGTDFSATEDGAVGDETFHFLDTTGSITLNLVGSTGNFGYRSEGVIVTIVADPVTTLVNVKDENQANLQNARVLIETSDATGDLPFEDIITITRVGTTATATHTAHGIPDGKKVVIRGATDSLYNGVFVITVVNANSYTYTMSGTPAASPASGTITASGVMLEGLTDASGNISESRTITLSQPVKGKARKSTTTPLYVTFPIAGAVDNVNGLTINIQMQRDD